MEAKPFLKWAGGKTQLLPQLEAHFPQELLDGKIGRYAEPFLGGGALFFALAQRFRFEKVYLSDINPELILAYRVVKEDVEALIARLEECQLTFDELPEWDRSNYFYMIREIYNDQGHGIDYADYSEDWVQRAAWMIFLNKTCFNGLYRVNAKGEFNVSFGRYKNPCICDEHNLRRVSQLLQGVELWAASYCSSLEWVTEDTFVYLDPPYRPISATSSFVSYASDGFSEAQQASLAGFCLCLDDIGVKFMVSNSDPTQVNPADTFFQYLYMNFNIHRVMASRAINSKAEKRGKIAELLITNY